MTTHEQRERARKAQEMKQKKERDQWYHDKFLGGRSLADDIRDERKREKKNMNGSK